MSTFILKYVKFNVLFQLVGLGLAKAASEGLARIREVAVMSKKGVSAIVSGAGWIGGFADKLIRALRQRGLTDEQIHALVTDEGDERVGQIAAVLAQPASKILGTFEIMLEGGIPASKLYSMGQYGGPMPEEVTDKRFPMTDHKPTKRTVVLLQRTYGEGYDKLMAEFKRHGLERPTYEDAFYFGIQHPEQQLKHEDIIFPHVSKNEHSVLVLGTSGDMLDPFRTMGISSMQKSICVVKMPKVEGGYEDAVLTGGGWGPGVYAGIRK